MVHYLIFIIVPGSCPHKISSFVARDSAQPPILLCRRTVEGDFTVDRRPSPLCFRSFVVHSLNCVCFAGGPFAHMFCPEAQNHIKDDSLDREMTTQFTISSPCIQGLTSLFLSVCIISTASTHHLPLPLIRRVRWFAS